MLACSDRGPISQRALSYPFAHAAAAVLMALWVCLPAEAGSISVSVPYSGALATPNGPPDTDTRKHAGLVLLMNIPQFNNFGGSLTLTSATASISGSDQIGIAIENKDTAQASIQTAIGGSLTLIFPATSKTTQSFFATVSQLSPAVNLAAADGTAGSGPDFHNFGAVTASGAAASPVSNISLLTGSGTFQATLADSMLASSSSSTSLLTISNPTHSGQATFTYIYSGVPGDGNHDGKTDGADYTIWADHFHASTTLGAAAGDFNGDVFVDGADYTVWADHFHATGAGLPQNDGPLAVPEPQAALLAITALAFFIVLGRHRCALRLAPATHRR